MGWKAFKERFGIKHIVHVTVDGVLIGSGYVSNIVRIDPRTGGITQNQTFSRFVEERYPALLEAKPAEILHLLEAEDCFSADLPTYTFEGGNIIEKRCEEAGWPNVTHDGCLMYDNRYFPDKSDAVRACRRDAEAGIRLLKQAIEDTEKKLAAQRQELSECEADLATLNAVYPDQELVS